MNRKSTFLVFSVASAVFLGSLAWAQNIPSNVTNTVALDRLSKVLKARAVADKAEAVSLARAQGFPVRQELPGGKIIEIQRLNARGKPVYYQTDNADAADTISTDEIQVGGSTGLGLTGSGLKIGEWDGGSVKASHNELTGRITNIDSAPISDHSTHVAGTMIASGARAAARGMSTAATIDAYDFNSDTGEMAGAAAGLLLSNHSYGLITGWIFDLSTNPGGWTWFGDLAISTDEDFYFGFYDSAAQAWDQIAFDAPNYLIVKSAGNDRNDAGTTGSHVHFDLDNNLVASSDSHDADCAPAGYDCISAEGTAKNILTVGAVEDIVGGYSTTTDVVMSDFSGWGPADDGRIKPDVVANGISLYSSLGGPNNKEYGYFSGTSMSAPNTTGSLLLLQEHYQDTHTGFMRSATLKALVIHTADEAGLADGPDYEHGWGLVNTESAARVITEDGGAHRIMEDVLLDGGIFSTQINVNEPYAVIKVTLVWTDPPGTPVADSLDPVDKMLVNDLDLRIYDSSGTYLPWVLDLANPASPASTGDNNTDNVEQVIVAGGTPGAYSVEVTHKGVLLSNTAQNFSLIISVEPRQQETIVFDEDFTGGLPTGWSLVNNVDSGTSSAFWEFDDLGLRDNLTGGTGRFASVDSDLAGNPSSTDAELHTASVDLSGFTQVALSFKSDFRYYDLAPDEIADVDVSIDGGSSWSNVWQRTGGSERGPTSQTVDLTTVAAGQADVRLRFHYYNAGWDWWWQVDDVQLSGQAVNGDVCGNPYNLPANQWRLISLPCDPGASNTVNDLFSDDLTGAYNITWVMYERDEVNDQYVRLELTSRLKQGLGYWIFSTDTTL
ncbi:MAG: S8 family serine peptidase, partial [Pseudomonadota bacterium]|nr:S8 family serine peptidase [Pseudomonadota bacterium]